MDCYLGREINPDPANKFTSLCGEVIQRVTDLDCCIVSSQYTTGLRYPLCLHSAQNKALLLVGVVCLVFLSPLLGLFGSWLPVIRNVHIFATLPPPKILN